MMIKVVRRAVAALPLVVGVTAVALMAAFPADAAGPAIAGDPGNAGPAAVATSRFVRLEDFRRNGGSQDEQHVRKREWHRHWDNRLDFWDPSRGRKVFVSDVYWKIASAIV